MTNNLIRKLLLVAVFLLFSYTTILAAQYKNAEVPINKQEYSANVKTMKYHKPGCKYYNCRDCTKFFKTPKAAQKAGYEPCKVCGG